MRKFSVFTMITMAVLMLGASAASAQTTTPKPPPTYEQVIVRNWKGMHDKILMMAKDTVFPEAKLGYKPHPDSRTMFQELRHVTIGLEMTTAQAKGEKYDFEAKEKEYDARPAVAGRGRQGNGSRDRRVVRRDGRPGFQAARQA